MSLRGQTWAGGEEGTWGGPSTESWDAGVGQHPPLTNPLPCTKKTPYPRAVLPAQPAPPPKPGLCWAWIAPMTPKHPPASHPPSTCSANAGINSAGRTGSLRSLPW